MATAEQQAALLEAYKARRTKPTDIGSTFSVPRVFEHGRSESGPHANAEINRLLEMEGRRLTGTRHSDNDLKFDSEPTPSPAGSASSAPAGSASSTDQEHLMTPLLDSIDDVADFLGSLDRIVAHYESEIMKTFPHDPVGQSKARQALRRKDKEFDAALKLADERKLFSLYLEKLCDESIPFAKRQALYHKAVRPLVEKMAPILDPLMEGDDEMDGSGLGALFGRSNPIQPGDVEKLQEGAKNFMADVVKRNKRKRPEEGSGLFDLTPVGKIKNFLTQGSGMCPGVS